MDGSYGNVFPANRGISPSTTPSSNDRYKVNVSRQKTRKWANFKPQNYDGDEWGADEYDEPDDEPELPPPPKPMGPRHPAANSQTARQFHPSDPPSLPSQAQHYSTAALPSNLERWATAPIGSPDQNVRESPAAGSPIVTDSNEIPGVSDNAKPALETRSTFPQATGPDASQAKPLPFVRPADVYRRMEEERRREQRPSDSEIPSSDNALGLQGSTQNQHTGAAPAETPYTFQGAPPPGALATVPERKSEYEIEGLVASYGSEEHNAEPATSQTQMENNIAASAEDRRRYSTSPQLPDVSRMSTFGVDLFSSSSFFPSTKSPQSPLASSTQLPVSNEGVAASGESAGAPSQSPITAAAQSADSPNERDQPSGPPLHEGSSSAGQPAADTSEQQQPTAEQPDAKPVRPSLPGGWVTETITPPSETSASTPPVSSQEATNEAAKSPAPSSGTGGNAPTDQGMSLSAHPASPRPLSILRASSPAQSPKLEIPSQRATPEIQTTEPNSPLPASAATQHSDITPTAPLNPRRDSRDSGVNSLARPVLSPPSIGTRSPADTANNSPVKESDVLSEEIIKSLSPMQSFATPAGVPETADDSTAAYHAAADALRESSYLGDVYDDYWGVTEDKQELSLPAIDKIGEPEPSAQAEAPKDGPAASSGDASSPPPANISEVQMGVPSGAKEHRRNFSWEAGLVAPVNIPPLVTELPAATGLPAATELPAATGLPATTEFPSEQKALGSDTAIPSISVAELAAPVPEPLQLSPSSKGGRSTADLHADPGLEVNQAAELPSRGLDSPSPASALSEGAAKRLSLADEKMLLQESTTPVSASPPLEHHPALTSDDQQFPEVVAAGGGATPPARKGTPVNVISFSRIMAMPSSTDRIKNYSEARYQMAEIETGLSEWLEAMLAKHPEHASAGFSFAGTAAAGSNAHQGAAHGHGGMVSQINLPHGSTIHLPATIQHGLSGLGQSGNQMGTKSKELLMAAGKAGKGFGKGLLSKGRNKLRGSGL